MRSCNPNEILTFKIFTSFESLAQLKEETHSSTTTLVERRRAHWPSSARRVFWAKGSWGLAKLCLLTVKLCDISFEIGNLSPGTIIQASTTLQICPLINQPIGRKPNHKDETESNKRVSDVFTSSKLSIYQCLALASSFNPNIIEPLLELRRCEDPQFMRLPLHETQLKVPH